MEEHQHSGRIYSAQELIVCDQCVTHDLKNGNECFCSCHSIQTEVKGCGKCMRYHQVERQLI